MPASSTLLKLAIIPVAAVAWVGFAGATDLCCSCAAITGGIFGSSANAAVAVEAEAQSSREQSRSQNSASGTIYEVPVRDLERKLTNFEKFEGKPMVIEVWATWCPPCRKQRPVMGKLAKEYDGKINFIAVSMDQGGAPAVKKFLETNAALPNEFVTTPEFNKVVRRFNPRGSIPTTFFVDSSGKIVSHEIGFHNEASVRRKVVALK